MRESAQDSPLIQRVRAIASGQLAPLAEKIDREGYYPREVLQALGAAGAYRAQMAAPQGDAEYASAIEAMAEVSSVCMSTGFMMWCQNVCSLYIEQSGNAALIERRLDAHICGATHAATALPRATARNAAAPIVIVGAGIAGWAAATAVRALDAARPITMIRVATPTCMPSRYCRLRWRNCAAQPLSSAKAAMPQRSVSTCA